MKFLTILAASAVFALVSQIGSAATAATVTATYSSTVSNVTGKLLSTSIFNGENVITTITFDDSGVSDYGTFGFVDLFKRGTVNMEFQTSGASLDLRAEMLFNAQSNDNGG